MSVINNEYLVNEDLEEKTATYRIEIGNFRTKLGNAQRGEKISTKKFFVNWSEFSIMIYITGDTQGDGGHLSLFLVNHSDWMVRADSEVSVKGKIFMSLGSAGHVFKSRDADFSDRSWGQSRCLPLSRCYNNDLLSHDGVLTIEVKVKVFAEKTSDGGSDVQKQLSILNKTLEKFSAVNEEVSDLRDKVAILEQASKGEFSGVRRKIIDLDCELDDLKRKVRRVRNEVKKNCE